MRSRRWLRGRGRGSRSRESTYPQAVRLQRKPGIEPPRRRRIAAVPPFQGIAEPETYRSRQDDDPRLAVTLGVRAATLRLRAVMLRLLGACITALGRKITAPGRNATVGVPERYNSGRNAPPPEP